MSSQKSQNFNHSSSNQNSTTSDFRFSAGIEGSSKMMESEDVLPTKDDILLPPTDLLEIGRSTPERFFSKEAISKIDEIVFPLKKNIIRRLKRTRNKCIRETNSTQRILRNIKLLRLVGLSGEKWNSVIAHKVGKVLKHHAELEKEIKQSVEGLSETESSEDSENDNDLKDYWAFSNDQKKSSEFPDYIYRYPSDSEESIETPTTDSCEKEAKLNVKQTNSFEKDVKLNAKQTNSSEKEATLNVQQTNTCEKEVQSNVKRKATSQKKGSSKLSSQNRPQNTTNVNSKISEHTSKNKFSDPLFLDRSFVEDEVHRSESSDDSSVEIIEGPVHQSDETEVDVTQVSELKVHVIQRLNEISQKSNKVVPGCKEPPPKPKLGFVLGKEMYFVWTIDINPNIHEAAFIFEIYGYSSETWMWELLHVCSKSPLKYLNKGHLSYAIRAADVKGRHSAFSTPVEINPIKANLRSSKPQFAIV